jgi:hypothetical protein
MGMIDRGGLDRRLAGSGVLLALIVLVLMVTGAADSEPGWAAPAPSVPQGFAPHVLQGFAPHVPQGISPRVPQAFAPTVTHTLFLPIIWRPETVEHNVWQAEYYDNMVLSGEPEVVTQELRIDYDWGTGSPDGLPANSFSARWTGQWGFEVGEYTFFVFADDGVRLWLDGVLLIDQWAAGGMAHQKAVSVETEGQHELKLEYFEQLGAATIRLHWRRTDLYPLWQGDYYSQAWVEGTPLYDRLDSAIQFDWGEECPESLPCDSFSIAWQATPLLLTGTQRIYLYADEGYQLFVNEAMVSHGGWDLGQPGGGQDVTYDFYVGSIGQHTIGLNFHDQGGLAEARLWIENLRDPDWEAEYYANMNLGGAPVATKHEPSIFYDWSFGKPYAALPSADQFSVRWTGQRYFHAGCYRFWVFADDGVRLWVDGELLVDEWHDARATYSAPLTYLGTGSHDIIVEYYENSNEAEIRLWWE